MNDDFSRYPESLTERKARQTNCAGDATPRDTLIEVLRKLDKGEIKPDVLLVAFAEWQNDKRTSQMYVSSKDRLLVVGLLADMLK